MAGENLGGGVRFDWIVEDERESGLVYDFPPESPVVQMRSACEGWGSGIADMRKSMRREAGYATDVVKSPF